MTTKRCPAYTSRQRSLTDVHTSRPTCYRCLRPHQHCVCSLVTAFSAHTDVLIVQHPHERRKYHSSTRLVLSAIENSALVRGIEFDVQLLRSLIGPRRPYLLYPSAKAEPCEQATLDDSSVLIVVDGTWDEAQKIVYRNPFLQTFPAISFQQTLESQYRIRKQPKAHCLSTLESIAHCLRLNASAHGRASSVKHYEDLLVGFNAMIDRQIPFHPKFSAQPLTLPES